MHPRKKRRERFGDQQYRYRGPRFPRDIDILNDLYARCDGINFSIYDIAEYIGACKVIPTPITSTGKSDWTFGLACEVRGGYVKVFVLFPYQNNGNLKHSIAFYTNEDGDDIDLKIETLVALLIQAFKTVCHVTTHVKPKDPVKTTRFKIFRIYLQCVSWLMALVAIGVSGVTFIKTQTLTLTQLYAAIFAIVIACIVGNLDKRETNVEQMIGTATILVVVGALFGCMHTGKFIADGRTVWQLISTVTWFLVFGVGVYIILQYSSTPNPFHLPLKTKYWINMKAKKIIVRTEEKSAQVYFDTQIGLDTVDDVISIATEAVLNDASWPENTFPVLKYGKIDILGTDVIRFAAKQIEVAA